MSQILKGPFRRSLRFRAWRVAEWTAVVQAAGTAVVIAALTVFLFWFTLDDEAEERRRMATERRGNAILLVASQPTFDSATRELVIAFTNPSSRPVIGDYVWMWADNYPEDIDERLLGVVGPGQRVELRFLVPESSIEHGLLRSNLYNVSLDHTGLLGERVRQEWDWQHYPPLETWQMTTLRIDPNVEGEPETELSL